MCVLIAIVNCIIYSLRLIWVSLVVFPSDEPMVQRQFGERRSKKVGKADISASVTNIQKVIEILPMNGNWFLQSKLLDQEKHFLVQLDRTKYSERKEVELFIDKITSLQSRESFSTSLPLFTLSRFRLFSYINKGAVSKVVCKQETSIT